MVEKKNPPPIRPELSPKIKRVVVKLGSQALTHEKGGVDLDKLKNIVRDVAHLHQTGLEIVLVSSGAIHSGLPFLPRPHRPTIEDLQACSAIGQPILMKTYIDLFGEHQLICAQVLLTHDDLKDRTRYLNARQTLQKLLHHKIIPILNENDSVSFAEISVGDNDQLAALVTELLGADTLVLLTGPDGLYNQDPSLVATAGKAPSITRYETVSYDENFEEVKLISKSAAGRGGMKTKLMAVRKLTPLGTSVIMATYKNSSPILRALCEKSGTFFLPAPRKISSERKSWLLALVKNHCAIEVDEGAFTALCAGSSLLPSGIRNLAGSFRRGDCVAISFDQKIFAVGLTEYDAGHIKKIMGKQSQDIFSILGQVISKVVVHRDNLALK